MSVESVNIKTIQDLFEYLKISRSTLYKLAQEGALPGTKAGRYWRLHKEVDDWMMRGAKTGKDGNKQ